MESLNAVKLRGVVGTIRISQFSETKVARMSVATNYAYRDKEGNAVIETTWHNVVAWEGKEIIRLESIEKGSKVEVFGRLRSQRYTGEDGVERTTFEVLARSLKVLDDNEVLSIEM